MGSWLCDVPVIMQLLFQQSRVYVNMMASQIQFLGRVLDNPVMSHRQVRTVLTCADYWRLHRCSAWDRLLTHPLWCNDRWQVHGWFCWLFAVLAVFPSFVGQTVMPRIMVGCVDVYGGFGRIYYVFHVKMNLDPEVDSRRGNRDIISTSSIWQFIRQLQRLLEVFQDIILTSFLWTSEGGFCSISRHFSHSVRMDVSAHFSALDDEDFFVVEGSGWRGRRESDFQVFCRAR